MPNHLLRCWACGFNEDHERCSSDGICRCGCEYNLLHDIAIVKVKKALEAESK